MTPRRRGLVGVALWVAASAPAWQARAAGRDCTLTPVLLEEFDEAAIASARIGPARWTAHTPWNGDFGDARFLDPGPNGPFAVGDGTLSITARKGPDGRWTSGLVAAADASGAGTGALYGYFEARMKLPPGPGTWPAFWLAALHPAADGADALLEVDVIEYYGQFPASYRSAWHVWRKPERAQAADHEIKVPEGALVADYHTYGVDISPTTMTFLLDGRPVWRQPTPAEHRFPLYPLVNLALGSGWPIDRTPDPSTLRVDSVHVFSRGPGSDCPVGLGP